MKNQSSGYMFKIYVDRPQIMIPKRIRKNYKPNELSETGHVFIGLTDAKGNEQRLGWNANTFDLGPQNVPPEDRIESLAKDAFKKVSGFIKDESANRYDDVFEYKISKKQFDAALAFIEKTKKENPKYVLLLNNCAVFAYKAALSAGVKPPKSLIGLKTPHGYSVSIRIQNKFKKLETVLKKTTNKIATFFDSKMPISKKAIENRSNISPLIRETTSKQR